MSNLKRHLKIWNKNGYFLKRKKEAILRLVEPASGDEVLDLGCCGGNISLILQGWGAKVVGVDSDPEAVRVARSRGVNAFCSPAENWTNYEPFTKVLMSDFTEHIEDWQLGRIVRRAEGKTIMIYTPNPKHPLEWLKRIGVLKKDESHVGLRTADELKRFFRGRNIEVWYERSHIPLFRWIFPRRRICMVVK